MPRGFEGPLATTSAPSTSSSTAAPSTPATPPAGGSGVRLSSRMQLAVAAAGVAVLALVMSRRSGGGVDVQGTADTTVTDLYTDLQPQIEGLSGAVSGLADQSQQNYEDLGDQIKALQPDETDTGGDVTPGPGPRGPKGPRGPRGPRGPKGGPKAGGGKNDGKNDGKGGKGKGGKNDGSKGSKDGGKKGGRFNQVRALALSPTGPRRNVKAPGAGGNAGPTKVTPATGTQTGGFKPPRTPTTAPAGRAPTQGRPTSTAAASATRAAQAQARPAVKAAPVKKAGSRK